MTGMHTAPAQPADCRAAALMRTSLCASILVVEDNACVRQVLVEALRTEGGYIVCSAGTVGAALALMGGCTENYDLLVLGVGLPDGDGRTLCASLRMEGFTLPVILLSDLSHEDDVARGFEAGADDYLVKPVSAGELLARVRSQLRHVVLNHEPVETSCRV